MGYPWKNLAPLNNTLNIKSANLPIKISSNPNQLLNSILHRNRPTTKYYGVILLKSSQVTEPNGKQPCATESVGRAAHHATLQSPASAKQNIKIKTNTQQSTESTKQNTRVQANTQKSTESAKQNTKVKAKTQTKF